MTIDDALAYFGNGQKMAKALGVGSNTISNWRARGNVIPLNVQWQIELGTKGALRADERPFVLGMKEIKESAKIPSWARVKGRKRAPNATEFLAKGAQCHRREAGLLCHLPLYFSTRGKMAKREKSRLTQEQQAELVKQMLEDAAKRYGPENPMWVQFCLSRYGISDVNPCFDLSQSTRRLTVQ